VRADTPAACNLEAWEICKATIVSLIAAAKLPVHRLYRTKSGGPRMLSRFSRPVSDRTEFETLGRAINHRIKDVVIPELEARGLPGCALDPSVEQWHKMWYLPNFVLKQRVIWSPVLSFDGPPMDVDEWLARAPKVSAATGHEARPVERPQPRQAQPVPPILRAARAHLSLADPALLKYLREHHGEGTRHHEANRIVFILYSKYGDAAEAAIEKVRDHFLGETDGEFREQEFENIVADCVRATLQ
jgi:hypothetical protein